MANFFPEGMQLPAPSRDTAGFWEACREHRLVVQRCKQCGSYRMVPVPVCYNCQSFEWESEQSEGTGEVFSYTIVVHSTHPGTREVVPYNAIVVKLNDCGQMKLTSNMIECENEEIHVGMPVELVWEDTTPEVAMPRFRPARKA